MDSHTDLAERILHGDTEAERELCVLSTPGIRQILARQLRNVAHVEKLTLEVLAEVLKRLRSQRPQRIEELVRQTAHELAVADNHADLAERVRKGDKQAENELYTLVTPDIRQILQRRLPNFAEDRTHDVFLILLERLRRGLLREPSRLVAYVAQIARNLAKGDRRKEHRRRTDNVPEEQLDALPDLEQDPMLTVETNKTAAMVHTVLQELPSRDRLVLIRWYLEDVDKASICRELGIQESTINVVLFRARERLHQLLQRRGLGPNELLSIFFIL